MLGGNFFTVDIDAIGAIEVFNPTWLVRAAMSAGGALEVLAPQDLRLKVGQGARRTLERYENTVK